MDFQASSGCAAAQDANSTVEFIHFDGRREAATNYIHLREVGGVPFYVGEIIFGLRPHLPSDTRILVTWKTNHVPKGIGRSKDLLFVVGDERGIYPTRTLEFGLAVKSGPMRLEIFDDLRSIADVYAAALGVLRLSRNLVQRAREFWQSGTPMLKPKNVIGIPLGPADGTYETTCAASPREMHQRAIDFCFLGSVGARFRFPFFREPIPAAPKSLARMRAIEAIRQLQSETPSLRAEILGSDIESSGRKTLNPQEYMALLSDTKVSVCPRGNFRDTFRHYESAALGCVVLSDKMERSWFTDQAPFVRLDSWAEAPRVMTSLINDPVRLAELGHASSEWWRGVAASGAVAEFLRKECATRDLTDVAAKPS